MKLNIRSFRYLSPEDWRVLTAFEMGSKNHEVVPTPLAAQLSGIHNGAAGVGRSISTLAKAGLIAKVKNAKYDGYRLTFGGYDYLALHAHAKSSAVVQLGSTMGVGKESDIWLVKSPSPLSDVPIQSILKIHRLGRTSFRTASTKRSYHGKREHASWQFLSRLSAQKEFQAMNVIRDAGFRTPRPIAWNRHTIVMSLIPGLPLRQVPLSAFGKIREGRDRALASLYAELIELVMRLADFGLIHGDMNEFNVLIEGVPEGQDDGTDETQNEEEQQLDDAKSNTGIDEHIMQEAEAETESALVPHLIDFPQITSMSHPQAEEFFDRDIRGIKDFFRKRYHFEPSDTGPHFTDAVERLKAAAARGERKLDIEIEAAGYNKKASRDLDAYYNNLGIDSKQDANASEQVEAESDGDLAAEADASGEVDLLASDEEPFAEPEEQDGSMQPAKSGFHDLLRGLEEMRVAEADSQATTSRPKSKKAAGWSI